MGWTPVRSTFFLESWFFIKSLDNKEQKIVGVNTFVEDEEPIKELQAIAHNLVAKQIKQVNQLNSTRDNNAVQLKLSELKSVANSEDNLMPSIIEAVRNKCTLGEIADTLRECFGEFNQSLLNFCYYYFTFDPRTSEQ